MHHHTHQPLHPTQEHTPFSPMSDMRRVVFKTLPRGSFLLHGGDLAYPNPSKDTYEKRLFKPYEAAFPPPPDIHPGHLVVHKPDLPQVKAQVRSMGGRCGFRGGNGGGGERLSICGACLKVCGLGLWGVGGWGVATQRPPCLLKHTENYHAC